MIIKATISLIFASIGVPILATDSILDKFKGLMGKQISSSTFKLTTRYNYIEKEPPLPRIESRLGYVKIMIENSTGNEVACKFMSLKEVGPEDAVNELKIMIKIQEPEKERPNRNIVKFIGAFLSAEKWKNKYRDFLVIVTEYAEKGTLANMFEPGTPLTTKRISKYTKDILQGLQFLKKRKYTMETYI